jgi:hypothetical protein
MRRCPALSRLALVLALYVVLIPSGCGSTADGEPASGQTGTTDTGSRTSTGNSDDEASCERLFGRPVEATGLSGDMCRPECPCLNDGWTPPEYDDAHIDDLAGRTLLDPPAELEGNPYETPEEHEEQPERVCGVVNDPDQSGAYGVETYSNEAEAVAGGAKVTHYGACGLCSSLQDLSVYMRYNDLTAPVRQCGLDGIAGGHDATLECLLELGFSRPCAQIWAYNTANTREQCLEVCLDAIDLPYHEPDGTLNACLQCDEENSGAVFKAVAGRTRRNTGLPSALCRPCDSVHEIVHEYD